MKTSILEYLEESARKYPDKTAFADEHTSCTFKELEQTARRTGTALAKHFTPRNPVPVFMEKSVETIGVFMGAVYAGCFYVPVNPMNPAERLRKIMEKLEPEVIISDEKGKEQNAEGIYEDRHINEEPVNSQEIFFQDAYEACNK